MRGLLLSILTAGLIAGASVSLNAYASEGWRHSSPPPKARYEPHPGSKRGYVWVPGYWAWNHNRYVWAGGYWLRDRPGHYYHAPRWVHRNGYYTFHDGRWSRSRDWDGDGVPNRYDRKPRDPYRR